MGEDQEFSLGHVKFEMPTRYPSGDEEQAVGYMSGVKGSGPGCGIQSERHHRRVGV